MWKWILAFLGGGILGLAAGFAVGIFVYPYLFLADIVASEEVADAAGRELLATGSFVHADPSDPIHYGRGGLRLFSDLLHLEADFEVGPGPKFHVYLVPRERVLSEEDVEGTMFVDLGRLKAFKGSQNYPLPGGLDPAAFGSVVIWCEQFGVLISPATIAFRS